MSFNPVKPLTVASGNNLPAASSSTTNENITYDIITTNTPAENTQTVPTITSVVTPSEDNTASTLSITASIPVVSTVIPSSAYNQTTPHLHSSTLPESTYVVPPNYGIPSTIKSTVTTLQVRLTITSPYTPSPTPLYPQLSTQHHSPLPVVQWFYLTSLSVPICPLML